MDHIHVGKTGEDHAVRYLIAQGYAIVCRNYRKSFGEIDIVARDQETVCFIEVKTRAGDTYGHPFEAVTPSKQRVLRRLAAAYLLDNVIGEPFVRFDVVAVVLRGEDPPDLELLKDAF